jgi:hypothetical protein
MVRTKAALANPLPYSTVKLTTALCVPADPPAADTVTAYRPALALVVAVTVNTSVPAPGATNEAGTAVADTPDGSPFTANATGASNPPLKLTRAVSFALAPGVTETALDDKLR